MKIGRTEKCWLAAVLLFWVFYNFPGFPATETLKDASFMVSSALSERSCMYLWGASSLSVNIP